MPDNLRVTSQPGQPRLNRSGLSAALFELDQRAEKILRMHERNAFAMHVRLQRAFAEHAHAFGARGGGCRFDIVDVETKMMNPAVRIAFEKFCHRRIGARGLHQFDFRIAEIDVGKAHTLLLEDDGEQLQRWAGENTSLSALSEVLRLYAVDALEREPVATLAQRIAFVHPKDFLGALVELEEHKK